MSPVTPARFEPRTAASVLALAALVCLTPAARADNDTPGGIIIPVHSGRMWEEAHRFELAVKKPLRRFETARGLDATRKDRFRVVCDFNPDGQPATSDNYEACLKMARTLRDFQNKHGVQTVAWVHGEVSHHSVLPVLACDERVFSDDTTTKFGKVVGPGTALEPGQRAEYEQQIRDRFTLPLAVHKMYDRSLFVVKINKGGIPLSEQYKEKKPGDPVRLDEERVPNLGAGDTALFGFDQAREFDLCQREPANDLDKLRRRYDLPESAVVRQSERPVVCRIVLAGKVGGGLKEQLQRRIDRAREQQADAVIFQIGCSDGDVGKAYDMALAILKLSDRSAPRPVETIAYVMPEARNTAALLAVACDRIVMNPKAELGNFDRYFDGHPDVAAARKKMDDLARRIADEKRENELRKDFEDARKELEDARKKIEPEAQEKLAEVAAKQGFPSALARAFATHGAHLHWVSSVKGESDRTFIDDTAFAADQGRQERRWRSIEELQPSQRGGYLTLSAEDALKYGVIDKVADDWSGSCELAGVEAKDVRLVSNDMLDQIAEFLREPVTQGVLIMLAIACLILELKMPGTAVPGIISGVCFVLFFWSQSQFNEETTTLAILLFILGLVLIALEVFVIPGFGVTGISGILLVIASLGLMVYGQWPRSGEDWVGLGRSMTPIGMSLLGAVGLAFVVARYLPHIPGANRLFLKPEGHAEEGDALPSAAGPDLSPLLGAIGTAASPLRPAGKMQLGDEFVDVVAEGGYIAPGTRVQVIEIEGNRVVVKEV